MKIYSHYGFNDFIICCALKINSETNQVTGFKEKTRADSAWVNAGFMVLDKGVFDYLGDGSEMLDAGPL